MIDTTLIAADEGIVRLAYQGQISYGLWDSSDKEGKIRLFEGSPFSGGKPGKDYALTKDAQLLAPCQPSKVVAIGLNYKAHAAEMNKALPEEPMMFMKPSTSVIGPGDKIVRPKRAKRVDFEAELGVVIGKTCKDVKEADAADYILGFTCLNDVTERYLQKKDIQYIRAKGFDTFCPLGPVIATDLDPAQVSVRSYLNNEPRQDSNTSDLIFSALRLVEFASEVMTLHPGDVIATGTPAGVGPMEAGDEICVELGGIGKLVNPVVDKAAL